MPSRALAIHSSKEALENLEKVVITGDLQALSPAERIGYYARVCESLGLNPLTRPFEYISLNNRLVLYARRDATDQLRKVNGISVTGIERDRDADLGLSIVTVSGRDKSGRTDSAIGVVNIKGLTGELMANALMKAETKAKRRMTLSLAGLGWLDETEIEDVVEPAPEQRVSLQDAITRRTEQIASAVAPTYNETVTYVGAELEPDDLGPLDPEDGLPDIPEPAADERHEAEATVKPATTPPAGPTLEDLLQATGGELVESAAAGPSAAGGGGSAPPPGGAAANPLASRIERARARARK